MNVHLVYLEKLLADLEDLKLFVESYPGAFLVAAGLLRAEELGPCQPIATIPNDAGPLVIESTRERRYSARYRLDITSVFRFGQRLIHSTEEPHALAGAAFHLRPTSGTAGVLVGRSSGCDITVPDASVSDEHCRIEVTEQGVVVVDLASTNGTSVNQSRIPAGEPQVLADEDIVAVGRYSFQLLSSPSLYEGLVQVRPLLDKGRSPSD